MKKLRRMIARTDSFCGGKEQSAWGMTPVLGSARYPRRARV